jgi:hypothetical protein
MRSNDYPIPACDRFPVSSPSPLSVSDWLVIVSMNDPMFDSARSCIPMSLEAENALRSSDLIQQMRSARKKRSAVSTR